MVSATLISPGVSVTITTQGVAPTPSPTTVPLIFIATRANKQTPDGTGIALGTVESNVLRVFTSQGDLLNAYGNPVFVTSDGLPVQGDETNEYGLLTAHTMLGLTNFAYILRADVDLGELMSTSVEPFFPAPNNTFWINSTTVVGGILAYNGSNWSAVPFHVYIVTPSSGDGANGDWAFDYSTLNGTLMFKFGGIWYPATTTNIETVLGATDPLYVQSATPSGAVAGDFWYKTSSSGGGTNLNLAKYRSSDGVWVIQPIVYSNTAPSPIQNTIWVDTSQLATTGFRPISIGTGAAFISLLVFVQTTAPTTAPPTGTLWYNDSFIDFAMYIENGNIWVPVVTTTVSNPTNYQKVISDSAPLFPQQDAIWIDVGSSGTNSELDLFPIVKRWRTDTLVWEDITGFHNLYIQSQDPIASLVLDGSYWINTGETITQNIVKKYDPTFVALTVNNVGATVPQLNNFWAPQTGRIFGRLSQRQVVVEAMRQIIADNQDIAIQPVHQ